MGTGLDVERRVVADGVDELSFASLPHLLELMYGGTTDAAQALGGPDGIRYTFTGFQPRLYTRS